ncbi:MAG: hypothetical protein JKY31_03015 [Rhodobacteraceae bacterium]|nr:hypothetical protein [Paracoccaceae bacterium]
MTTKIFRKFISDQSGAAMAFILIMFLLLVVGGGMAVDFMRHEGERAKLQDAIDRGVLAATAFTQTSDVTLVVESFLNYRELNALEDGALTITVVPDIALNSRRVSATASYEIDTFFLKIIGIPTLPVAARGAAEIARNEIELSLVLDISYSMNGAKIASLISASNTFVDLMLTADSIPHTTVSIVPFSPNVNVGAQLASYYNFNAWHNYSYCAEFSDASFNTTAISTTAPLIQGQHWRLGTNRYWCPRAANDITPLSNDPLVLHAAINSLVVERYTSAWAGLKWGAALLDPSAQPAVIDLIADGSVDPIFSGRPAAFDDEDALKFMILMSDGDNTWHRVMKDSDYAHYSHTETYSQRNADYWDDHNMPNWNSGSHNNSAMTINSNEGDARMRDICTASKAQGIILFTIAFQVSAGSRAYRELSSCATSPSHFFHVEGLSLDETFETIAATIQRLKLTQ